MPFGVGRGRTNRTLAPAGDERGGGEPGASELVTAIVGPAGPGGDRACTPRSEGVRAPVRRVLPAPLRQRAADSTMVLESEPAWRNVPPAGRRTSWKSGR